MLGQNDEWYNVEYNGLSGYVRNDFVVAGGSIEDLEDAIKLFR